MRDPDRGEGGKTSRRQLLRSGLGLALVLAAAGVAAGRTRGYAVPGGRKLVWMTAWQWVVVDHMIRIESCVARSIR